MSIQAVLLPVFVQVGLTFILLLLMGRARFTALRAREVKLGDIALGQNAWPDRPAQFARSYQNQFELPILFYVLVVLAIITKKDDLLFVVFGLGQDFFHLKFRAINIRKGLLPPDPIA